MGVILLWRMLWSIHGYCRGCPFLNLRKRFFSAGHNDLYHFIQFSAFHSSIRWFFWTLYLKHFVLIKATRGYALCVGRLLNRRLLSLPIFYCQVRHECELVSPKSSAKVDEKLRESQEKLEMEEKRALAKVTFCDVYSTCQCYLGCMIDRLSSTKFVVWKLDFPSIYEFFFCIILILFSQKYLCL